MTINIFTNYSKFNEENILIDNDSFFNEYVIAKDFDDMEIRAMKKIDSATLIDSGIGTIQTPMGVTSIDNLSTGCKTVLNYLYLCKHKNTDIKAIDVSMCGANALEVLFAAMEEIEVDMNLVLMHRDNLHECKARSYRINGQRIINDLLYI